MNIKRYVGGMLESNGYIIYNEAGGDCFIIDPGYRPRRFVDFAEKNRLHCRGILITHHHYDHTGGAAASGEALGCPVYIHKNDIEYYKKGRAEAVKDGDEFTLALGNGGSGREKIKVIGTPGHTRGGVCYYLAGHRIVFTGDTIFNVDLGRTDFEGGSQVQMESTVRNIVSRWSDDTVIYPGHGGSCSMGYVRKENTEYIRIMETSSDETQGEK